MSPTLPFRAFSLIDHKDLGDLLSREIVGKYSPRSARCTTSRIVPILLAFLIILASMLLSSSSQDCQRQKLARR